MAGGGGLSASSSASNTTTVGPLTMGSVTFGPQSGGGSGTNWILIALAAVVVFFLWKKK